MSYYTPPVTRTQGGTTTVIGGTVLPPITTTVTPNPHPPTTGTIDPHLNTKSTSWKSGKPSSPTCAVGHICGIPPIDFPNPDCPWCPPGVFGNPLSGGGGSSGNPNNNNDDNDHSSSTTSTSETGTATITKAGYGIDIGGAYPTTYAAMSDLQALASSQSSKWNSMFSDGGGTSKTTTTTTTKPTPTPTAADGTTDETPSEKGDWCLIYAWAMHSVGGGGPGQSPLDEIVTGIETFGPDNNLVFDANGIDLAGMSDQDNVIDQDDWKGLGDVTVRTAYDGISSAFTNCEFQYGGTWYDGTIKNDIDSNYVSDMSSDCTIYLSC